MDKLEYIPGDLVKFATNTYTIVNFEENFLYNKICYALISTNSTKTAFVAGRDILPIPLTPEILEKNGWVKDKEAYINDSYHLHLCGKYDRYSVYKVVNDNIVWLTDIRNVSDLQHLLFGLGINNEMEV
ncbi:hypothetical protein [Segatella copri]|uniref:Uncharacterized protein n=1 Tax=Segatella copri TaxID=165179 RepID=A0AAW4N3L9_9BACT|nr:hypothetical protein [Segatella copri]MBV3386875.1 hypothetical protein [Segatella copri]MBV3394636.1 hypothetical protein [Segatella copri]MBV3404944.1 hypothetical protein [Segatella copri]